MQWVVSLWKFMNWFGTNPVQDWGCFIVVSKKLLKSQYKTIFKTFWVFKYIIFLAFTHFLTVLIWPAYLFIFYLTFITWYYFFFNSFWRVLFLHDCLQRTTPKIIAKLYEYNSFWFFSILFSLVRLCDIMVIHTSDTFLLLYIHLTHFYYYK